MNRLIVIVVAVLVVIYLGATSIFVVNTREQAIVTRFGQITGVYEDPGIHFKIPTEFIEKVQIIEKRLMRYDLSDIRLQVKGGKFYNVDAFLTYRITDPVKFRESVLGSLTLAEQRINTVFESALRDVYGKREFDAALSEERSDMMREARDVIRPEIEELGIEVDDVRILRTDLTPEVSSQTYDRMKAERLAEAARLRARGQEQAQTLRAIADRQAVETVAEANRDAEILRGEGDSERNKIFAKVYQVDPEFFEFYRSMSAYKSALGSDDTTMVLSPDSEFFNFFENDGAEAAGKPTGKAITDIPTLSAPEPEVDAAGDLVNSDEDEEAAPIGAAPSAVTLDDATKPIDPEALPEEPSLEDATPSTSSDTTE